MFSVRQKRTIANEVQQILRRTNHPELPKGEIQFQLKVAGATPMSWAIIQNNGAVSKPSVNPWNESQDKNRGGIKDSLRDYKNSLRDYKMKIKVEATLIIQANRINSNKSPEEIVLAVENKINELQGFKITEEKLESINAYSETNIIGIRFHAEKIKEVDERKPK